MLDDMDISEPPPQQTLERKEFEHFLFAGLILLLVLALVSFLYEIATGSEDRTPPRIITVVPRADQFYRVGTALSFQAIDRGGSGVESVTGLLADSERNFVQPVLSGFVPEPGVYILAIEAKDKAGNTAKRQRIPFVIYDQGIRSISLGKGEFFSPSRQRGKEVQAEFEFEIHYKSGVPIGTLVVKEQRIRGGDDGEDDGEVGDSDGRGGRFETVVDARRFDWFVVHDGLVRLQGRGESEDKEKSLFRMTARDGGERPQDDSVEIKLWEDDETDEDPELVRNGFLSAGGVNIYELERGGFDSVASLRSQYGIDPNTSFAEFLTQAQLELLSAPALLETVLSPFALHSCNVSPFSQSAARGGESAAYLVTLNSPVSGNPFVLLTGALPDDVEVVWSTPVGVSLPEHAVTLWLRAKAQALPRSLSLLVIYEELPAGGVALKSFCQLNLVIQ